MARYQNGAVRTEQRSDGLTWVYRFQVTRCDGKRVEHKTALGLVTTIGELEKDAWAEVDRQRLREHANQHQPFRGKPKTYRQLCQHYIENELQEDQSEATIEKAYTTTETYRRILDKRVIPRFGSRSPLTIEPLEIEKWLKELKKAESLENPTLDKIRRVMNLVYTHGQRYGLIPRDESANPMNWVRQKTTSSYTAIIMNPSQAFGILLNIPEPRRTLVLTDAATALRVSEILGLTWGDLDFENLVMHVRRAYVWGRFKEPKSKASKAPVPMHTVLVGFLLAWRERTPYGRDEDFVFASFRLKGKKPLSASIMVQKYLRPAAAKAGVLSSHLDEDGKLVEDDPRRFGFHNFRHSLASSLVKMKCDPKTVQGILRHEDVRTTMQLYAQSDQESRLEAQGKFLELLLQDKAHMVTGAVQ
jgi:integrase